jgi:hypothetical protein
VTGLQVLLLHPETATRNCGHCREWLYDERTGEVMAHRHTGDPMRRGLVPVPCEGERGCPKGHWSKPLELTPTNLRVYRHYLTCKAVGDFPNDSIVRENAACIRAAEESVERIRADRVGEGIAAIGAVVAAVAALSKGR